MLEGQLQSVCIDWLQYQENKGKLWFTRLNTIPPVSKQNGKIVFRKMPKGAKTGLADLLIFKDQRTIWIELKSDKGKQSDNQKAFGEASQIHSNSEYYVVKDFVQFKGLVGE